MKSKLNKKMLFGILLGTLISATTVYAVSVYQADEISFSSNVGLSSSNIQDAIDEVARKLNDNSNLCSDSAIVFSPNGGMIGESNDIVIEKIGTGQTTLNTQVPTKTGYAFDGWYLTKETGSQMVIDRFLNFRNNVPSLTDSSGQWISKDIVPLYAHWTAKTYEVRFFDKDNYQREELNIKYGSTAFDYNRVPTVYSYNRENYSLDGWYVKDNNTFTTKVLDENGKLFYSENSEYVNSSKRWIYDGNVDLFVKINPILKLGVASFDSCPYSYNGCGNSAYSNYSIRSEIAVGNGIYIRLAYDTSNLTVEKVCVGNNNTCIENLSSVDTGVYRIAGSSINDNSYLYITLKKQNTIYSYPIKLVK